MAASFSQEILNLNWQNLWRGKKKNCIFIQRSNNSLFFRHLDVRLGKSTATQKTNKEIVVEIQESVRGKDVYIIQTGTK